MRARWPVVALLSLLVAGCVGPEESAADEEDWTLEPCDQRPPEPEGVDCPEETGREEGDPLSRSF